MNIFLLLNHAIVIRDKGKKFQSQLKESKQIHYMLLRFQLASNSRNNFLCLV